MQPAQALLQPTDWGLCCARGTDPSGTRLPFTQKPPTFTSPLYTQSSAPTCPSFSRRELHLGCS
ncbi:unnamed protein product [Gulo gulo]|uniref:Uncharacterized protein n=1 Tax=Gulo gulo TaxID=48420 RepID=A0A9X9Q8H7_GULGU|nr:unnamed protein product [Gulo gulo]